MQGKIYSVGHSERASSLAAGLYTGGLAAHLEMTWASREVSGAVEATPISLEDCAPALRHVGRRRISGHRLDIDDVALRK